MSNVVLVLRWTAALLSAAIVFTVVFFISTLLLMRLGAGIGTTYNFSLTLTTGAAVLCGALIVPRHLASVSALTVWILVLLFQCWIMADAVRAGHILVSLWELSDVFMGGFTIWYLIRSGVLGPRRRRSPAPR
jgi:hypothetical protein